jgi:hypothetical protein
MNPAMPTFVSCSALESTTHGALLSIGSLWPFVGEIGIEPFVSFCGYAECYYNKQNNNNCML